MVDFETELKTARELFEKRLNTVKRIKYHLHRLLKTSDEHSAGEVALKVAESELNIAHQQLELTIQRIRKQPVAVNNERANIKYSTNTERDHFSEALARVDPKTRLQLAR